MSYVTEHVETDVRERILVVAERLFREIGYQKTTVADIAKALQMSPANVYRFFDSKKSINAGVARKLMGQVEQASQAIATSRGSAAGRLRKLLTTVHQMHEMVACAMEENWDVCRAHMEFITSVIANVIASGVASAEFHVRDPGTAAMCTCAAMIRFFHPQLIAESANKPGPTLDQMIDFVIAGLGGADLAQ
jgi:AcrR family transcriptional regulator